MSPRPHSHIQPLNSFPVVVVAKKARYHSPEISPSSGKENIPPWAGFAARGYRGPPPAEQVKNELRASHPEAEDLKPTREATEKENELLKYQLWRETQEKSSNVNAIYRLQMQVVLAQREAAAKEEELKVLKEKVSKMEKVVVAAKTLLPRPRRLGDLAFARTCMLEDDLKKAIEDCECELAMTE